MELKTNKRDWEIIGIFLFLALLTLGLVSGLRWIVLTPESPQNAIVQPVNPERSPTGK